MSLPDLSHIRGVVWDLDGTLYRYDALFKDACQLAAARTAIDLGIDMSFEEAVALAMESERLYGNSFRLFGAPADAQLFKNTMTVGGADLFFCGTDYGDYKDHVYDLSALEALQTIPHTGSTLVLEFLGIQNSAGENECFGIDQIELTVYPLLGTMIRVR